VEKGQSYSIRLVEPLDVYDASIHVTTLDGWPSCWQRLVFSPLAIFRRCPFDPWFAMICSVDKQHRFRITYDGYEFAAPATGELYCYFNDVPFFYKNNRGTVRISVDAI